MVRGKPKLLSNNSVKHAGTPAGCIAMKGDGDCHYTVNGQRHACCFLNSADCDGFLSCSGDGPYAMGCILPDPGSDEAVAYRRINE
jgi:hypothetical protein